MLDNAYDVAIVGSGVAGALVADRLAGQGLKVLMIEAGPWIDGQEVFQNTSSSPEWDISAGYPDPEIAPRVGGPRTSEVLRINGGEPSTVEYLRNVGGTTWHWSGIAPRYLPSDLSTKSSFGYGVDWPLTYDELEPYYCDAEDELGISGDSDADYGAPRSRPFPVDPMPFSAFDRKIAAALAPYGIELQPTPQPRGLKPYQGRPACEGHNLCTPICPIGAQYNASIHVRRAQDKGCAVSADTVVTKVSAGPDGHIRHLEYKRPDGSRGTISARIYLLAANGLETPRLLLASRDDAHPDGIANRSGVVGRYLMDHAEVHYTIRMTEPVYPGRGPLSLSVSSSFRDGPFRTARAGGLLVVDNNLNLRPIVHELAVAGHAGPDFDRRLRAEAARRFRFIVIAEEKPDYDNRITLDWTRRDGAGLPAMDIVHLIDPYSHAAGDYLGGLLKKMTDDGLLHVVGRRDAQLSSHLMGTIRMGNDAATSALDRHGRSHDHPNLFVAGSAAFPTGGTGNPTLTIAALSLWTADAMSRHLRSTLD